MTTDFTANKPSVDSELERTLNGIGIPPRPIIIDRITQEMRKDEPNFNYLGQLITADVSLAASLIKMANSPYFGLQGRARSVNDAVLMLGLKVTSRAIAGLSLRRAFPASPQLERFWSASAQTAALSGWLVSALEIPGLHADEAYTFGLFRDCGIPTTNLSSPSPMWRSSNIRPITPRSDACWRRTGGCQRRSAWRSAIITICRSSTQLKPACLQRACK